MFSVELSNKTQLLSESSVSVSGSNTAPGYGLMHGSYTATGGLFE